MYLALQVVNNNGCGISLRGPSGKHIKSMRAVDGGLKFPGCVLAVEGVYFRSLQQVRRKKSFFVKKNFFIGGVRLEGGSYSPDSEFGPILHAKSSKKCETLLHARKKGYAAITAFTREATATVFQGVCSSWRDPVKAHRHGTKKKSSGVAGSICPGSLPEKVVGNGGIYVQAHCRNHREWRDLCPGSLPEKRRG